MGYLLGTVFKHKNYYYILTQCDEDKWALISIHNGNRWKNAQSINAIENEIDEQDFRKLIGDRSSVESWKVSSDENY
jgi:hypothetical protein